MLTAGEIKVFGDIISGLEDQLKLAAEAFLDSDDGLSIDMNKKQIMLTKILSWYQEDFGKNKEEVLQWILANLPDGERKSQLKELLGGKSYKVGYKHYDWGLNS